MRTFINVPCDSFIYLHKFCTSMINSKMIALVMFASLAVFVVASVPMQIIGEASAQGNTTGNQTGNYTDASDESGNISGLLTGIP
jgi:hypothetical protein